MPQLCLHPNDATQGVATISGPLSSNETALRKIIDLQGLLPGDLILTTSIAPNLIQRSIRAVQKKGGYPEEHARWEHAAMYIGKGVLCEATRKGVQRQMLSHYVGSHILRLRRAPNLLPTTQHELAIQALSFQGYPYGYWEIVRLVKAAKLGFSNNTNATGRTSGYPSPAVICSELYADSYAKVTRNVIGNISGGEVTPASLSIETTLQDVAMRWLAIP